MMDGMWNELQLRAELDTLNKLCQAAHAKTGSYYRYEREMIDILEARHGQMYFADHPITRERLALFTDISPEIRSQIEKAAEHWSPLPDLIKTDGRRTWCPSMYHELVRLRAEVGQ
jgi:hypothetical protein